MRPGLASCLEAMKRPPKQRVPDAPITGYEEVDVELRKVCFPAVAFPRTRASVLCCLRVFECAAALANEMATRCVPSGRLLRVLDLSELSAGGCRPTRGIWTAPCLFMWSTCEDDHHR